ncbi:unnamed protein product [Effrenium voratum]|uniref:Uncharacterized protein n=1 Tax=Effrenium voratum TaxID=2562239 RepID=A0AA36JH09_9DINO|nr:unnamed protein product [Effrenium voratum]
MTALADGAILACRLPGTGLHWALWPCREVALIRSPADSKSRPLISMCACVICSRKLKSASRMVVPCNVRRNLRARRITALGPRWLVSNLVELLPMWVQLECQYRSISQ